MAGEPTAAYQELSQYAASSDTAGPIATAETYLENLSSTVTKDISAHKIVLTIAGLILVGGSIATYWYLKKEKK